MDALQELRASLEGQVLTDDASCHEVSGDFGRMVVRVPRAVVRPASTKDVAAVLRYGNRHGITISTRGAAHSQSGQALNEGGILLDMTSLNKILALDPNAPSLRGQAGVLWSEVVQQVAGDHWIPPVLTNNLNVTLGGTISVAGLGVASHRYGTQADQCIELEVVTATGDIVRCSQEENSELFHCVRAGLGQFGVITEVTLRLRKAHPRVRTYFLLYDDLPALMKDARQVMSDGRFDYLESWCVPCPQGFRKADGQKQAFAQWFYPLHLTAEFAAEAPRNEKLLADLSFYRHVHTEDGTLVEFANRLENLFALWKRSGYWATAHPWMETILPWEAAGPYISQVLANFPPPALGGGHVLLWPCRGTGSQPPLFQFPRRDFVMGFGILPGIPIEFAADAVARLNLASDLSIAAGGKRYLSGLISFDQARWRAHFGERWADLVRWKNRYDPKHLLNPGFIPFD